MKKLLIACIMGALMTGAWAVQQANAFSATKESFESMSADATLDVSDERTDKQWVCEDTDATLKAVAYTEEDKAYTYGTPTANTRATTFGTDQAKYLSIDTGSGKPLWRTLAENGSDTAQAVSYSSEDGEASYVIDTLVQFTGTDTAPTPLTSEEGAYADKFILWMKTVEDDNGNKTSSLHVICGDLNPECGSQVGVGESYRAPLDLELDKAVTEGQWARISVKAVSVAEESTIGFVLYIDGEAVAVKETEDVPYIGTTLATEEDGNWVPANGVITLMYDEDAKSDFNILSNSDVSDIAKYYINKKQFIPSIVAEDSNITKVGFEGSGKIDDVQIVATGDDAPAFTKYTPSAVTTHTVSFVAKGSDGGTPAWSANDLTVNDGEAIPTASIPATDKVDGYTFAGWFSDETCETSFDMTTTITGDKTIYVYFTKNVTTYTVTFAQKGLEGDAATAWTVPGTQQIESGSTITSLPNIQTVDGYTASGWQYDDGTAYEAQAITGAITLYVTYTVVETDPDPIAPGATAEFTDKTKADTWAANKDNIVIPSSLTTDAAKDAYKSYLVGTVTGDDTDGYTVTFDIDSTKEAALETALEEVLPKVLDGTEITTAVPGFYYAVKACDTVGGEYAVKGDWAQAGVDGTVTLSVTKTKGKTAEFYKIVVQAVDPNAAK